MSEDTKNGSPGPSGDNNQQFAKEMTDIVRAMSTAGEPLVVADGGGGKGRKNIDRYSGLKGQHLTQYVDMGSGYVPTTKTAPSILPGVYKAGQLQNGSPFFHRMTLCTDDILDLPDSKSQEVVTEIKKFWTLKDLYTKFKLSYKRGFLLYGPPGSGKTCTISLIVKHMIESEEGVVLFADNMTSASMCLASFREIEPDRRLTVIIEDVDTIATYQEKELLALLDGEDQVENVVFIATTNYPEKLDARIINRPSRFDKIVKIDLPNAASRKLYLSKKIDGFTAPDGTDLVTASKGLSLAHLRELVVSIYVFGMNVGEVIERLQKMKIAPKSTTNGVLGIISTFGNGDNSNDE